MDGASSIDSLRLLAGSEWADRLIAGVRRELIDELFRHLAEGFVMTDAEGTIESVNPAFASITGYSQQEAIGRNPRMLQSGVHGKPFYETMWSEVTERGRWQGEIWNRRKSGEPYLQEMTLVAVKDRQGRIIHYIAFLKDITEREKIRKDVQLTGELQRRFIREDRTNERFAISSIYRPAQYVSGDMFDYIWHPDSGVLFGYVVDLMGHGLATALQIPLLHALFRQAEAIPGCLRDKLVWINREAVRYFHQDTFAAAICFELDFHRDRFVYASGGINRFLLLSGGTMRLMEVAGPFIGMSEQAGYEEHRLPLSGAAGFFFMSDGLMEMLGDTMFARWTDFETTMQELRALAGGGIKDDATALCVHVTEQEDFGQKRRGYE
ncbi:MAG: PAS domain-containing protein [Paenibacillaceae bacterium]|nr:PAS domain-containing protein [Paenibacillaceae bacterium]